MKNIYLNIEGLCNNMQPIYTKSTMRSEQKEDLSSTEVHALFGALYFIARNNQDLLTEYGLTIEQVMEDSAMQGDLLYLNGFEGYWLDDRYKIEGLFLNKYDCVMILLYDHKKDKFYNFVA